MPCGLFLIPNSKTWIYFCHIDPSENEQVFIIVQHLLNFLRCKTCKKLVGQKTLPMTQKGDFKFKQILNLFSLEENIREGDSIRISILIFFSFL